MEMVRLANAALINGEKSKWTDNRLCENVRYVKVIARLNQRQSKGLTAMKNEFTYNPSNPYLVVKDGVEIGAMIDNVLYRFDYSHKIHTGKYFLIDKYFLNLTKKLGI